MRIRPKERLAIYLAALLAVLLAARAYSAELQLDTASADNGKLISEGAFNEAITAPGGLYRMTTTAKLHGIGPNYRDAVEVDFQGVMYHGLIGRVTKPSNSGVVLLYTGQADKPAIHSVVHGGVYSGVNLWRRFYQDPRPNPKWSGTGWRFENPASNTRLSDGSLAGWELGILFAKSHHTEHFLIENYHVHDCRVFFRNEENQSTTHHFQNIFQYGYCETMFQYALVPGGNGGGGCISYDTIIVQAPDIRVLDIEKSNSNSCTHDFKNLSIDGGCEYWKLVRQRKGPLSLTVRGHIDKDAPPAIDAIDVEDASKLDIEMFWLGKIWPRDFEVVNGKWQARPEVTP